MQQRLSRHLVARATQQRWNADAAAALATTTMLDLMERELAISRHEALALASVSVDLHVTQVVNVAKGVHAILRA